jgi:hypothetical protein
MDYRVGVMTPRPLAYTPQEVEALLSRFGFGSIETQTDMNDIIYASAEAWWAFQLTLVPRSAIMGTNEETRARFKDEYLAKLRPMFRQGGLHLPLGIIYALAKRWAIEASPKARNQKPP